MDKQFALEAVVAAALVVGVVLPSVWSRRPDRQRAARKAMKILFGREKRRDDGGPE
jgi:hypothetical protein